MFRPYRVREVIGEEVEAIQRKYEFLKPGRKIGLQFETQRDERGEFFEFLGDRSIIKVYVEAENEV